jgi:hypothetical protein
VCCDVAEKLKGKKMDEKTYAVVLTQCKWTGITTEHVCYDDKDVCDAICDYDQRVVKIEYTKLGDDNDDT